MLGPSGEATAWWPQIRRTSQDGCSWRIAIVHHACFSTAVGVCIPYSVRSPEYGYVVLLACIATGQIRWRDTRRTWVKSAWMTGLNADQDSTNMAGSRTVDHSSNRPTLAHWTMGDIRNITTSYPQATIRHPHFCPSPNLMIVHKSTTQ